MTALTLPAQPGHEASPRPVPWRRMAWITWRQHRLAVAGVVAVLGAASVYLYIAGEQLRHQGFISYGAGPVLSITAVLFQVIPPLIGGMSGKSDTRALVETPRARTRPLLIIPAAGGMSQNMRSIWPPTTSFNAGRLPL